MPKANLKALMYAAVFLKPHLQAMSSGRNKRHHARYAVEHEKQHQLYSILPKYLHFDCKDTKFLRKIFLFNTNYRELNTN